MKTRYSLIALALLLVPLVGTATAGGGKGVDESLLTVDLSVVNGRILYIAPDLSIWEETNDARGLQTARTIFGPTFSVEPDYRVSGA